MTYLIEELNPCNYCPDHVCMKLYGHECEREATFHKVKAEAEKVDAELQTTRDYIHDHNLEWDLASYMKRREREASKV